MESFELTELLSRHDASRDAYFEFLRVPDLSMGIYVLPAGGTDPQSPHTEDEVYYVVRGKAEVRVSEEDRPVHAGSIIYVPKNVVHRFHSIREDLVVLVLFSPAEYSSRAQNQADGD